LVEAHPVHEAGGVGVDAPGIDGIGLATPKSRGGIDLGGVCSRSTAVRYLATLFMGFAARISI
jgi:hypothetical protein